MSAPEVGEGRWPVLVTMAVAIVLPFLLPDKFTPGPRWLLPAIEVGFLVAVALKDPGRIDGISRQVRQVRRAFVLLLAFNAAWATIVLTADLIDSGPETQTASTLLRIGGIVWVNIVLAFGFLYWELDDGGPGARSHTPTAYPDLAFPQQLNPDLAPPGWRPVFFDYLHVGLTAALAFSPTDAMPMAHWAKLAMGVEAVISLLILGLVIARAVNILN